MIPCRYCGCINISICTDGDIWWCRCDSCLARGPIGHFRQSAEDFWNGDRRPEEVQREINYIP